MMYWITLNSDISRSSLIICCVVVTPMLPCSRRSLVIPSFSLLDAWLVLVFLVWSAQLDSLKAFTACWPVPDPDALLDVFLLSVSVMVGSGNEKVAGITLANKDMICGKVLADELASETAFANSKEWNVNGEKVTISVEKM